MGEQIITLRMARETDLPHLKELILPEFRFESQMRKLPIFIATHPLIQVIFAAISVAFASESGGLLMWIVAYISINAVTIFIVVVVAVLLMMKFARHLWNWEVCKREFTEGFWVAEIDIDCEKRVVGSYALTRPMREAQAFLKQSSCGATIELQRMAVASEMRRKGVGTRLVNHACNNAKALGYETIALIATETAQAGIALYTKTGFKPVKILGFPRLTKAHLMAKTL